MFDIKEYPEVYPSPDGRQYITAGDYLDDWSRLMLWEVYDPKLEIEVLKKLGI
ncbi:MAG: hypothetical protein WBE68_17510 [Candidatus Nitrosopolaris sp.]